jgi:hypothetical protein
MEGKMNEPFGQMKVNPLKNGGATVTVNISPEVWEEHVDLFRQLNFGLVSLRKHDPNSQAIMEPVDIDKNLSGLELIEQAEIMHREAGKLYKQGVASLRAAVEPLLS